MRDEVLLDTYVPKTTTNTPGGGERKVTMTSTTIHQLSAVEAHPASEEGALDGFAVSCTCGERASFSIRSMTEKHGQDHLAYFARQGHTVVGR